MCIYILLYVFRRQAVFCFFLHRMSFSLGADLNTVLTPALLRIRLIWWLIAGTYGMHAYDLSSLSPRFSNLKGSTSKSDLVSVSSACVGFCLFLFCVRSFFVSIEGGEY